MTENGEEEKGTKRPKSFWETVPGILTGIAAIVTAIGGCVAVIASNPRLLDSLLSSASTPIATLALTPTPSSTETPN